jgi:hypothetical protein
MAYLSRNAHRSVDLTIRDDWESLCYIIYALVWGDLPWINQTDSNKMKSEKEEFVMKEMWKRGQFPECFCHFFGYILKS